jgi:hypothetical protein
MLNVARFTGPLLYPPNGVMLSVSADNGRTFAQTVLVNSSANSALTGLNTDQPVVDADDRGVFCVAWRHRWNHAEFWHPVARCGQVGVNPTNGALTVNFLTGVMNLPDASRLFQNVGGLNVRMVRRPVSGTSHAVVVYSTPIVGDPGNHLDCQGRTRRAGVQFFSTEADISLLPGSPSWSSPSKITEDPDFDYCPIQGVATYDRQFSLAIDSRTGANLVAIPFNRRPGTLAQPHIRVFTGGVGGWRIASTVALPGAPRVSYFFPNLAADGAGRVGLSFYAGVPPQDSSADRWFVRSADSARSGSWGIPVRLSPSFPTVLQGDDRSIGDYQELVAIPPGLGAGFRGTFYDSWSSFTGTPLTKAVNVAGVVVR